MGIPLHERILDSIEAYFGLSPQMLALSVEVPQPDSDRGTMRLSLRAARELVADPVSPPGAGDPDMIWPELVSLARETKEPWELAAVWMMVPGLRRICRRCRRYSASVDPSELEAEAVAGLIEALRVADPGREALGGWLWWTTYRHVQHACSRNRNEAVTADIELVAALETWGYDESRSSSSKLRLSDDTVSVANEPEVVGGASLEGERLGALAHRMGLERALDPSEGPEAGPAERAA